MTTKNQASKLEEEIARLRAKIKDNEPETEPENAGDVKGDVKQFKFNKEERQELLNILFFGSKNAANIGDLATIWKYIDIIRG